jgi:D-alanyl-D-alanine carboxypeptidase/D-alanyl-D-alanine-endopeptidase (penicillin-binding protein 4)
MTVKTPFIQANFMPPKLQSAICLFLSCCLFSSTTWAELATSTLALPAPVAAAFKRAGIPNSGVGIYIQEANTPNTVITFNHSIGFNPASTMKLVTSAAALDVLGPTYTWKTRAFIDGQQSDGVLNGDLIFKGGGDPKLVIENFWLFLRQIQAQGIRDIRGNVILDRTLFATDTYDAARFDGDPAKPYNVGPDALLLNYKALAMRLTPEVVTGKAKVNLDTPFSGLDIIRPQLSNDGCGAWQSKMHVVSTPSRIGFDGKMSLSCGEKTWNVHPYNLTQTQYFEGMFRQMWHDLGGKFQGGVVAGTVPADARLIAEHESVALPEVIRDMNKFSNNVIARHLLLTMASESENAGQQNAATTERGAQVVKTWMASKGIDNPEVVIENGSGLSRIARISAGTLGRVLIAAYRAPTMPEFMSSLPLVGLDGTMRRRLQDRGVAGRAHIKTGALNDVRAIAGYVLAASGKYYVVVCLINDVNASRGQEAQDLLLQWVYEQG